jgi:hypothetical protein
MEDDRWIRMNQLIIDLREIEAISWQESKGYPGELSVRFHMKTGNYHTRRLQPEQLKIFRDKYKGAIGDDLYEGGELD